MPDVAAFCADCGAPISVETENDEIGAYSLNLKTRAAAAASYFAVVPAILWLFVDPFRRESFVRFHAFQSIIFAAAAIVVAIAVRVLWIPLLLIPGGFLFATLATIAITIGGFVLWAVVIVKAGQGAKFRIPFMGRLAERLASNSI